MGKLRTSKECVALINETIEYYKNNDRAIRNGDCLYYDNGTGNMCAVGRCLEDPENYSDRVNNVKNLLQSEGDVMFQEKYRNYPSELWDELQDFHDNSLNWNGRELTERGDKEARELRVNWT